MVGVCLTGSHLATQDQATNRVSGSCGLRTALLVLCQFAVLISHVADAAFAVPIEELSPMFGIAAPCPQPMKTNQSLVVGSLWNGFCVCGPLWVVGTRCGVELCLCAMLWSLRNSTNFTHLRGVGLKAPKASIPTKFKTVVRFTTKRFLRELICFLSGLMRVCARWGCGWLEWNLLFVGYFGIGQSAIAAVCGGSAAEVQCRSWAA
eukprot:938115-Amphidinium_carterae.1